MNRQLKRIALAATIAAVSGLQTIPANACGGRGGGGFGISFGGGHGGGVFRGGYSGGGYSQAPSAPVYHRPAQAVQSYPSYPSAPPVYSQPVYSQPAYAQPAYAQPAAPQPNYAQPTYSQPGVSPSNFSPPTSSQPGVSPASHAQPNVAASQSVQQSQPMPSGPVNQQSAAPTNNRVAGSLTSVTAAKPITQQSIATPVATTKTVSAATAAAQPSALEMLASITLDHTSNATPDVTAVEIPEFTAAVTSAPNVEAHVGTWSVTLPGNQSVTLDLGADGKFNWTATKDGKSNHFDGQFRLEGDRLTLVRSQDLQQMAGSWSGSEGSFTFKLDGATNSGLAFARQ